MGPSDAPNPGRRPSPAGLCFCIGAGLCTLAYVLGITAVIGAALSGGDPAVIVGSLLSAIAIGAAGVIGFVMMLIGGVWMIVQVVADQRGDVEEKRYRDVER